MSMYINSPLPDNPEQLKSAISAELGWAIHMSRLVALRATRRTVKQDRKKNIADVQLRQLLGSLEVLRMKLNSRETTRF